MAYAYNHLTSPQNTTSGIADFLLLAPVSSFAADGIKCPEAPFTNPGDEVTVRQPHVFNSGEGFIKVTLAPEKNKLDLNTVGDKGFQKFDEQLVAFVAGSYAQVHEAIKNWLNVPLIILVKDSNCAANEWYQLGCDCLAAYMSAKFATGTTKDNTKGYELNFSVQTDYVTLYAPVDGGGVPIDPISQLKA